MSRPDTVYTIYIASTPARVFEALTTALDHLGIATVTTEDVLSA